MSAGRIGVVCDYLEERWPSMDLVADRLVDALRARDRFTPSVLRPSLRRRLTRLPFVPEDGRFGTVDRLVNRHFDYPRWLSRQPRMDLYHVIDHSYAHLVNGLAHSRTVVTCHDLDAFRSLLRPAAESRTAAFRWLAGRTKRGLGNASRVICDTAAVRDELLAEGMCAAERLRVIPLGVDEVFSSVPESGADARATQLLGCAGTDRPELLHVGSTIPRKRIDVLLKAFAAVRRSCPDAVLVRVGGLTTAQRTLARELDVSASVITLPFVDTGVLAALYRRARVVVQPSDREGFGLPVLEALACGTPVVASDLPVHRETGGAAAVYCPPGDDMAFARAIVAAVNAPDPGARAFAVSHAARFTWSAHAAAVEAVYRELL